MYYERGTIFNIAMQWWIYQNSITVGLFLFSPGGLSVRIAVCYVYPGLGFVYVVLTCNFFFSSRLMRYFSARSIIRMICSFLRSSLVRACPFCSDCYTNFLPILALFSQLTDSRFALSLCYVVGACARVLLAYLIIVNNLEVAWRYHLSRYDLATSDRAANFNQGNWPAQIRIPPKNL